MAQAMYGDLFVLYVDTGADESDENQRTLADNVRFSESVGAKVVKTEGKVDETKANLKNAGEDIKDAAKRVFGGD